MTTTAPIPPLFEITRDVPSPLNLPQGVEVYNWNRGPNIVEAVVQMSSIDRDDVPVDESHVAELADQLENERENRGTKGGQISNIELGMIEGTDRLVVIDGFHRTAALELLGRETVYATVQCNMTMDEVWDRRIQTARQSTVMFARLPEWINASWQLTSMAESLTVRQAFKLAKDGSAKDISAVDPEVVEAAISWARDKTKAWGKGLTVSKVYSDLTTSQYADPELRRQVREKSAFSKEHLLTIAKELPLDFPAQNLVAGIVMSNNFDVAHTRMVAQEFAKTTSVAQARALATSRDWRLIQVPPKAMLTKSRRPTSAQSVIDGAPTYQDPSTEQSLASTELTRKLLLAEIALGKKSVGEFVTLDDSYRSPHDTQRGEISFTVRGDTGLREAAAPLDIESRSAALAKITKGMMPKLTENLVAQVRIRPEQAHYIIEAAQRRIIKDMRDGDLRYVDITKSHDFTSRFLVKTIHEELHRKRGQIREDYVQSDPCIGQVTAEQVLEALPTLSDRARAIVVFKGLLGVSSKAVACITDTTIGTVVDQTWSVYNAIKK